jgi:polyphosphate kinase
VCGCYIWRVSKDILFNRELSWLGFNERVLQEAADERVPLIERLRFLGIFSNNLDEFYRVRVAALHRMVQLGKHTATTLGFGVAETLDQIGERVLELQDQFNALFDQIESEMAAGGVHFVDEQQLSAEQREFAEGYFSRVVRPTLVPIMVSDVGMPELSDGAGYLAVEFTVKEDRKFALLALPDRLPRFLVLPSVPAQAHVMFVDDVIRVGLAKLFALFEPKGIHAYAIKVTRDAEIDMDDDLSKSLVQKMRKGVANRKKGDYVRFSFDRNMSKDMRSFLVKKLKIKNEDNVLPGGRYHNRKDLMGFPALGPADWVFKPMPPLAHPHLSMNTSLLRQVALRDVLLHYPYHNFDYIVDLLRESAIDPKVKSIKINLYRVAPHSHVINALVSAVRNGKDVQVVIELHARFDERNNIKVASTLKDAGVGVIFGVPGLKTHSKLVLIKRSGSHNVAYISSGNFNESTSRVYSDLGLLSADRRVTLEVAALFEFFQHNYKVPKFKHLLVSPFTMRSGLERLVDFEIAEAQAGRPAHITVKCNNLVDPGLIERLYAAGAAGVKVDLIVRGICSLRAGVAGLSENIAVRSIVGRFLEHARVFVFAGGGTPSYYLSSADWMTRNIDRRIEVTVPIYDPALRMQLDTFLSLQLSDNVKARIVDADQSNRYARDTSPAGDSKQAVNAQEEMYAHYSVAK